MFWVSLQPEKGVNICLLWQKKSRSTHWHRNLSHDYLISTLFMSIVRSEFQCVKRTFKRHYLSTRAIFQPATCTNVVTCEECLPEEKKKERHELNMKGGVLESESIGVRWVGVLTGAGGKSEVPEGIDVKARMPRKQLLEGGWAAFVHEGERRLGKKKEPCHNAC